MRKLRIAVIFGGISSEHEVSLVSAKSVIDHIPSGKYDVIKLGITKQGKWLLYRGGTEKLPDSSWDQDEGNLTAFIPPDAGIGGILVLAKNGGVETIKIDAVFPVLHGIGGEDGTVQGLLTLAGIPFVGCPVTASAVCMDKAVTKAVLDAYGIVQTPWLSASVRELETGGAAIVEKAEKSLGYPMFVKPANAGSSVGISKARDRSGLNKAIDLAAGHDRKVVFEQAVTGREIECAVLGGLEPVASCCGEILPETDFYDYDAKYNDNTTKLSIPARLPDGVEDRIRKEAVEIFRLLGCEGMTRMDFFYRESDDTILFNEPNTIPGFTSISMYPKLFEASGLRYGDLLDTLIKIALER